MKKLIYQVILVFICSVTSFFSYSQDMGDAKLLNSSEDWKGFSFSLSAQAYTSIFDINNRENSARLGFFSLRSRAYITKRFLAKAEVFLHPEDRTNLMSIPEHINRQFSFGWMSEAGVGIGFGMENGDRYFGTGHEHDSTWHNLRFRAPGQTNYKFIRGLVCPSIWQHLSCLVECWNEFSDGEFVEGYAASKSAKYGVDALCGF
jgi:hypothetical protein